MVAVLAVVLGQFMLIPLVGAALLFLCFRKVDAPKQITFLESWKVYFAAVCCGLMLIVVLNCVMPTLQIGFAEVVTLQAAVPCVAQFLMILLLLRRYSRKALLAQGCVVLLTNMIATAVLLSALPAQ